MKIVLINPNWRFEGSIYFGCREPHLPVEFGAARLLLEQAGHEVTLLDAHMFNIPLADLSAEVRAAQPDMVVMTTAPTYLFWRCAPPELRVCQELSLALRDMVALLVAVGPHGSTTPKAALRKLGVDMVVMGECEEALLRIAAGQSDVPGTCWCNGNDIRIVGGPQATDFASLPPLDWPSEMVSRHRHHHHRFDVEPLGPGAEVEASRGCPYNCTFCAKIDFRDKYRRRPVPVVMEEIRRLEAQGTEYVYFIDEIFLPNTELLEALKASRVSFGVQTRIDLWKPDMLELLGQAGCVSVEAGVESLTPEGRDALAKRCKLTTDELAERLICAKQHIPFVQANLIEMTQDDEEEVERWRTKMTNAGIWANDPVPMFPYPGSPDYREMWGMPDDYAWERAVDYYLRVFDSFSELQEDRPLGLRELELEMPA